MNFRHFHICHVSTKDRVMKQLWTHGHSYARVKHSLPHSLIQQNLEP